jgi:hypothetical protein
VTGIEHYREAERLIDEANSRTDRFPSDEYAQTIAEAQVHATLALAAATALKPSSRARWGHVAGRQRADR